MVSVSASKTGIGGGKPYKYHSSFLEVFCLELEYAIKEGIRPEIRKQAEDFQKDLEDSKLQNQKEALARRVVRHATQTKNQPFTRKNATQTKNQPFAKFASKFANKYKTSKERNQNHKTA